MALSSALPAAPVATPPGQFISSVGFVEARIDGSPPLLFLVDTGASASAIDSAVARRLNLPVGPETSVEGSTGTITAGTTEIRQIGFGDLASGPIKPTVSDLSGSLAPNGRTIAGILGYDALKNFAVEFAARAGHIRFARRSADLLGGRSGQVIPFALDNNIPRFTIELRGIPAAMRLDTGAAIGDGPAVFANIAPSFHDRLRAAFPQLKPYTHFTASGTGGAIEIPVLPGGPMTIAGRTVEDVRLIVQPAVGYFARPEAVGFLGLYALRSWSAVIVDYPAGQLILVD